jgi:hypothetical protein
LWIYYTVLTKCSQKVKIKNKKKFQEQKFSVPACALHSSVDVELPILPSVVFKLCDLLSVSLPLILSKCSISPKKLLVPKNQGKSSPPKPKRAYNVLNLSDKVKI